MDLFRPDAGCASGCDERRGNSGLRFLFKRNPSYDGLVCLPGSHSKWVRVKDGEIRSFQTYMTGELFALLAERSILKHTVRTESFDSDVFCEAITTAAEQPTEVIRRLFLLRSGCLLDKILPDQTRLTVVRLPDWAGDGSCRREFRRLADRCYRFGRIGDPILSWRWRFWVRIAHRWMGLQLFWPGSAPPMRGLIIHNGLGIRLRPIFLSKPP